MQPECQVHPKSSDTTKKHRSFGDPYGKSKDQQTKCSAGGRRHDTWDHGDEVLDSTDHLRNQKAKNHRYPGFRPTNGQPYA